MLKGVRLLATHMDASPLGDRRRPLHPSLRVGLGTMKAIQRFSCRVRRPRTLHSMERPWVDQGRT